MSDTPPAVVHRPCMAALAWPRILVALSLVLAAGCYTVSLHGEFAFDDHLALVNNDDTRPNSAIGNMLFHDFWGQSIESASSHKSYRPLTTLAFRQLRTLSQQWFAGEDRTIVFHSANVAMHCIATLLVYIIGALASFAPAPVSSRDMSASSSPPSLPSPLRGLSCDSDSHFHRFILRPSARSRCRRVVVWCHRRAAICSAPRAYRGSVWNCMSQRAHVECVCSDCFLDVAPRASRSIGRPRDQVYHLVERFSSMSGTV